MVAKIIAYSAHVFPCPHYYDTSYSIDSNQSDRRNIDFDEKGESNAFEVTHIRSTLVNGVHYGGFP